MPDTATQDKATTTTPAAAPAGAPAALPGAPAALPGAPETALEAASAEPAAPKAVTLAELRAARKEAAQPAATTTTTTPPANGATTETAPPARSAVDVAVDPAQLAMFASLNKELRAARDKIKELSTASEPAQQLAAAKKLAAEGKHYDAIRALGLDFDSAVAEVVGAPGATKPDPELAKLREEIAALKAGVSETQQQQTAAQRAAREAAVDNIAARVAADGKTYPYLARSKEWVREALTGADEAYAQAVAANGGPLTQEQKDQLIAAALTVAEERRAAESKLYAPAAPAPAEAPPRAPEGRPGPRTITSAVRSAVTAPRAGGPKTLDEIRRERRAASR